MAGKAAGARPAVRVPHLSASSSTKKRTASSGSFPLSTRSITLPGVPVTMSTPSAKALTGRSSICASDQKLRTEPCNREQQPQLRQQEDKQ